VPSNFQAIENLIATYAERVDDGDFAGVAELLADAIFTGAAGFRTDLVGDVSRHLQHHSSDRW
jgi:hypothetical protein